MSAFNKWWEGHRMDLDYPNCEEDFQEQMWLAWNAALDHAANVARGAFVSDHFKAMGESIALDIEKEKA